MDYQLDGIEARVIARAKAEATLASFASRGIGISLRLGSARKALGQVGPQIWYTGPAYPGPLDQAAVERNRLNIVAVLRQRMDVQPEVLDNPVQARAQAQNEPEVATYIRSALPQTGRKSKGVK